MVQTRLYKHSLSKKEQAVSSVASRASVRDPIDEFQDVYGSRAASAVFRQQLGSDFSRSGQIQPPIQAKPSFQGISQSLAAESEAVQLKEEENKTGLPDDLKTGVESLSGYLLDDVRVHYNSSKPAQFQALAYTQGTEIHVGAGQEKHLAHEAWHVVQQMQRRVKPTIQMKGLQINDDDGLEQEADRMGIQVLQMNQFNQNMMGLTCQGSLSGRQEIQVISPSLSIASTNVLQRAISLRDKDQELSATQAFEQIREKVIRFAVPPNALLQVLTRFDFTNRSFTGIQELALEVERLLKEEYSLPYPSISSEGQIIAAAPDDFVILARGCNSIEQLNNILKNSSAGGGSLNRSVTAPSEESAISDVAFEGVPWKVSGAKQAARRQVPRIEFTTNVGVLRSFADRGGAIVVKIQKKYLAKGSGSEGGWISDVSAPVAVLWVSE